MQIGLKVWAIKLTLDQCKGKFILKLSPLRKCQNVECAGFIDLCVSLICSVILPSNSKVWMCVCTSKYYWYTHSSNVLLSPSDLIVLCIFTFDCFMSHSQNINFIVITPQFLLDKNSTIIESLSSSIQVWAKKWVRFLKISLFWQKKFFFSSAVFLKKKI